MNLKLIGYKNTTDELKQILTTGRSKKGQNIGIKFRAVVKKLNDNYGQNISLKFLRALFPSEYGNRQRTKRINYLIKKGGLKTKRIQRIFRGWIFQKWNADITEYQHTKGFIYKDSCVLTDDEQEQLRVIALIKENNNVEIYPQAQHDLTERQRVRNAINRDGGVRIKDVRVQEVSKCFIGNQKEVILSIVGY